MKISGMKYNFETLLLVKIADSLEFLAWAKTESAQKGMSKPNMILPKLLGNEDKNDIVTFETQEEFEELWSTITG